MLALSQLQSLNARQVPLISVMVLPDLTPVENCKVHVMMLRTVGRMLHADGVYYTDLWPLPDFIP